MSRFPVPGETLLSIHAAPGAIGFTSGSFSDPCMCLHPHGRVCGNCHAGHFPGPTRHPPASQPGDAPQSGILSLLFPTLPWLPLLLRPAHAFSSALSFSPIVEPSTRPASDAQHVIAKCMEKPLSPPRQEGCSFLNSTPRTPGKWIPLRNSPLW